jgi:hypothetical protein
MSGSNSNKKNDPTAIPIKKSLPCHHQKSQQTVLPSPNSHSTLDPYWLHPEKPCLWRKRLVCRFEARGYAIIRFFKLLHLSLCLFRLRCFFSGCPFVTAGLGTAQRATITNDMI